MEEVQQYKFFNKDYYMEKFNLEDDLNLICVKAESFPEGIMKSFERLNEKIDSKKNRHLYGISFPGKDGAIVYRAAANELYDGEAESLGCESFIVKKGTYNSILIFDFMNDIPRIGEAFKELLSNPGIDPEGCCVEMYLNNENVRCMVRMKPDSE